VGSSGSAAFDVVIQHHHAANEKRQDAENGSNSSSNMAFHQLDEMDIQIMQYMLSGYSGTDISKK
jgi:hypothetical protein